MLGKCTAVGEMYSKRGNALLYVGEIYCSWGNVLYFGKSIRKIALYHS